MSGSFARIAVEAQIAAYRAAVGDAAYSRMLTYAETRCPGCWTRSYHGEAHTPLCRLAPERRAAAA